MVLVKKKNKILFVISGLHFEKSEGAKNRLDLFIESYSNKGFEVSVILFFSLSSLKYWFSRKQFLNPRAKWYTFPTLPISKNIYLTRISRGINQFSFFFISRWVKPKIIQLEATGLEARWAPNGAYVITDFHGDAVSEEIFRNNGKKNWLSSWFIREQRLSLKHSDFTITVSENLKEVLTEHTGVKIDHFAVMPCAVDLTKFNTAKELVNELPQERIIIGYLGGLQRWQNFDAMLDLVIRLRMKNDRIFFAIFTNDSTLNFQEKLSKIGKGNYFVKGLKGNEVPIYLQNIDAGLLLRHEDKLNIVSSPTKIAEYLASGVPLICTQFSGDYKRCVKHMVEGFVLDDVSPTDSEVIELLQYLERVKTQRNEFASKCIQAAHKQSWESSFDSLYRTINSHLN